MSRRTFLLVTLSVVFVGLGIAGASRSASPAPNTEKLGAKVELAVHDGNGQPARWTGAKATVVVFLSSDCPVSNSYAEPLTELTQQYAPRGVAFVGFSTTGASANEVAKQAKELGFGFPVYPDAKRAAVEAFQAKTTPEAFVLDQHQVLRYRGRIDNGYVARLKKSPQTTQHELRAALDDLLAGRPVQVAATAAVGCPIVHESPAVVAGANVTYHRDVAPILQKNCQGCHRPGEVGPFALLTYPQAARWATDIKDLTQSRKMPPWKPSEGLPFVHDRRMADKEIATLAAWVDAGAPEGDPKDTPPPANFPDGWQLGPPDLVLTVPEEFTVGPTGTDLFRCFVLPTGLTVDKHVVAFEVRPGNPRVVHHTLNIIDTSGRGRELEREQREKDRTAKQLPDHGPGYSVTMGVGFLPRGGIGGWAPGQMPRYLPDGVGYMLPKDSDVVLQVHYHRTGRVEKDRTQVGLYFARKPITHRIQSLAVGLAPLWETVFFAIPAGAESFPVKRSLWTADDCTLYSVMPHMHLIGRKVRVTMTPPDGPTTTLVAIDDWDYNWQETYFLKQPLRVKAGTRFEIEAVYDNSPGNPNNPSDPPRPVRFGEQTTNEMCFGFLGVTGDKPGPVRFYIDKDWKVLLPRRAAPQSGPSGK